MAWNEHDAFGYVALSGATEVSVELDKRYAYKIIHSQIDAAGNDDANSEKTAWLSTSSGAITADLVFDEDEQPIAQPIVQSPQPQPYANAFASACQ